MITVGKHCYTNKELLLDMDNRFDSMEHKLQMIMEKLGCDTFDSDIREEFEKFMDKMGQTLNKKHISLFCDIYWEAVDECINYDLDKLFKRGGFSDFVAMGEEFPEIATGMRKVIKDFKVVYGME